MITEPQEIVQPIYTIYKFNDSFYKIVKFKGLRNYNYKSKVKSSDSKLDNSLSRTKKVILELALCNEWQFFFTGTFNPNLWDRTNISILKSKLLQWIRDRNKAYNSKISFVLIPEQHKDGSWHFHGLLSGIPINRLSHFNPSVHPSDLCRDDFWNWEDFSNKFGFCSLSFVRNPLSCGFYVTKYISKQMTDLKDRLGFHLYYCSKNLKRSLSYAYGYIPNPDIDKYITNDYEFCSTGYVIADREIDDLMWLDDLEIISNVDFHKFDNFQDLQEQHEFIFEQLYL